VLRRQWQCFPSAVCPQAQQELLASQAARLEQCKADAEARQQQLLAEHAVHKAAAEARQQQLAAELEGCRAAAERAEQVLQVRAAVLAVCCRHSFPFWGPMHVAFSMCAFHDGPVRAPRRPCRLHGRPLCATMAPCVQSWSHARHGHACHHCRMPSFDTLTNTNAPRILVPQRALMGRAMATLCTCTKSGRPMWCQSAPWRRCAWHEHTHTQEHKHTRAHARTRAQIQARTITHACAHIHAHSHRRSWRPQGQQQRRACKSCRRRCRRRD